MRLVEPGDGQPMARVAVPAKIEPSTLAISPDGPRRVGRARQLTQCTDPTRPIRADRQCRGFNLG
ncbi:hypothetical protein AB4Z54_55175, partial [Streptomyces sp. MCAF7]